MQGKNQALSKYETRFSKLYQNIHMRFSIPTIKELWSGERDFINTRVFPYLQHNIILFWQYDRGRHWKYIFLISFNIPNILIYFKLTKATSSIKTKSNGFWLPRVINKWKVIVLFPLLPYGFVDNFWNVPFKFYFSDVES